jgi:hypothetical protein
MFLRLRNDRLLRDAEVTYLSESALAGDTQLLTLSNEKFAGTNFYLLVEGFGVEQGELVPFSSAFEEDALLCGASLKFDHAEGTPVYLIKANSVLFYYSASENGTFSTLPTGVPAVDVQSLDVSSAYTVFEDVTHSDGFGKACFYNSVANSQYGPFHEIVKYNADDRKTRGFVKRVALGRMNATIDGIDITESFINDIVTECDSRLRDEKMTWTEETAQLIVRPEKGITEYDISSYVKDSKTIHSILNGYVGNEKIEVVTRDLFYERVGEAVKTKLASPATVAGATIIVEDSSLLKDSGQVYIGGQLITYTTLNRTTNTLTGITGMVADINLVTSAGNTEEVWQGATYGKPDTFTVIGGKLISYPVINQDVDAQSFKIDYTQTFININDDSDELAFPSYLYIDFLKSAIAEKRGDKDAERKEQRFDKDVLKHVAADPTAVDNKFTPRQNPYGRRR